MCICKEGEGLWLVKLELGVSVINVSCFIRTIFVFIRTGANSCREEHFTLYTLQVFTVHLYTFIHHIHLKRYTVVHLYTPYTYTVSYTYTLNTQHYTIIHTAVSTLCSTPLYTSLQRLNNCTHILLWNVMLCPWKPKIIHCEVGGFIYVYIHSVKQALKRYRAAVQFKMWLAVSYLMALYSCAPREVDIYGDRGGTAWRKWRFCKLFGSQGILSEESLIWGKYINASLQIQEARKTQRLSKSVKF